LGHQDVRLQRRQGLEVDALVAIVVAVARRRQHLDDHHRVGRRLAVVGRMLGGTADHRAIGVASAHARGDPEPLIGRVVAARA
jgi:hypothetical protein